MQTESAIKSKTIPALKIPEQFETLLGEIKNGMEIKISRGGVVIAGMVPEPIAAKKNAPARLLWKRQSDFRRAVRQASVQIFGRKPGRAILKVYFDTSALIKLYYPEAL